MLCTSSRGRTPDDHHFPIVKNSSLPNPVSRFRATIALLLSLHKFMFLDLVEYRPYGCETAYTDIKPLFKTLLKRARRPGDEQR